MTDTTLIVQGRLMNDTYRFYCEKYPQFRKVFCTWESNEKECEWKDTSIVRHSPNDVFMRRRRHERFSAYDYALELWLLNVIEALEVTKTNLVMILRGDEWYSNLNMVADAVRNQPEKMYTIPAFFKRWEVSPFHASDHLLAGRAEDIRLMFCRCLFNMVIRNGDSFLGRPLSGTGMLYRGYVEAKSGGNPDKKSEFKRLFDIIPLDALKYYKITSEESGRHWYSNFTPRDDGSWEGSISSMEEL